MLLLVLCGRKLRRSGSVRPRPRPRDQQALNQGSTGARTVQLVGCVVDLLLQRSLHQLQRLQQRARG
jgi:hypothetical protein